MGSNQNIKLGNHWSGWFDLTGVVEKTFSLDSVMNNLDKPGGYIIRVDGHEIHRFGGIDQLGIIHIGQSKHLRDRITQFYRCLEMSDINKCGHMAGWRYRWLKISDAIPKHTLKIAWRNAKGSENPKDVEAKAMRCYINYYKELPPLNYQYNWSKECGCDATFVAI